MRKKNILYCDNDRTNSIGREIEKLKKEIYDKKIKSLKFMCEREYPAKKLINDLFSAFMKELKPLNKDNVDNNQLFLMLPEHVQSRIQNHLENNSDNKEQLLARSVCDYISGMTDRYAIYFWQRMRTPIALE